MFGLIYGQFTLILENLPKNDRAMSMSYTYLMRVRFILQVQVFQEEWLI